MVGLEEQGVDEAQGATGQSPLQKEGGRGGVGPEGGGSAVALCPAASLLRPLGLPVPVSPLGAEGTAQRSTGTGRGATLVAQGRVPEPCESTQSQNYSETNINQLRA